MGDERESLAWIDSQPEQMLRLVTDWSRINSGTTNLEGLSRMADAIEREFNSLGAARQRIELPPYESVNSGGQLERHPLGSALRFVKRSDTAKRVLLCIHFDTVYPPEHPFQKVTQPEANLLCGPGVADAKGGLVVMLTSLRALEQSAVAARIGWEVILNPDEEIGSPGSSGLLSDAAKRNQAGLVFEPALPDGSLVGARKGSGNFTIIVRGRAAHAGRDFHLGRSAILVLAELIGRIDAVQRDLPGVTINCGRVEGGGALNIVPDLAIGRFNVRVDDVKVQQDVESRINAIMVGFSHRDGIALELHGGFHSPPKPLDTRSTALFDAARACGRELGLDLQIKPSGGACDGNRLVAAGLPTIDTLGPRGGNLHSDQEYLLIDTLTERAKLTAMLLFRLASGQIAV